MLAVGIPLPKQAGCMGLVLGNIEKVKTIIMQKIITIIMIIILCTSTCNVDTAMTIIILIVDAMP